MRNEVRASKMGIAVDNIVVAVLGEEEKVRMRIENGREKRRGRRR